MREVTQEMILSALQAVGVKQGDGLLVHSALQYLGAPSSLSTAQREDGVRSDDVHSAGWPTLEIYLRALKSTIGNKGTLVVPTFNFAFAQGESYDPATTPSSGMGVFSEYVRLQPGARRTPHPMQSLAVLGRYASDLSERDTPSAFDPGSAFERMLELDFKILLLGATVNAISLLHYSEQRYHVPYRYWKDFSGQVKTASGWQALTYRMYVRDLKIDPRLDLDTVQARLQERKLWASVPLNYGRVSSCRIADFVAVVDELLATDPWSLVTNRPA